MIIVNLWHKILATLMFSAKVTHFNLIHESNPISSSGVALLLQTFFLEDALS